jgi:hypothetical protein
VLKIDSEIIDIIIKFFDFKSKEALIKQIENIKQKMIVTSNRYYDE